MKLSIPFCLMLTSVAKSETHIPTDRPLRHSSGANQQLNELSNSLRKLEELPRATADQRMELSALIAQLTRGLSNQSLPVSAILESLVSEEETKSGLVNVSISALAAKLERMLDRNSGKDFLQVQDAVAELVTGLAIFKFKDSPEKFKNGRFFRTQVLELLQGTSGSIRGLISNAIDDNILGSDSQYRSRVIHTLFGLAPPNLSGEQLAAYKKRIVQALRP